MGELAPRRPIRAALGSMFVALLLVVAMGTAAFAQYPPAQALDVACTPEEPNPGDEVTCTISGAPANIVLEVTVMLRGTTLFDDTVTTDDDGVAQFSFVVPEDEQSRARIVITISGDEIRGQLVEVLAVTAEDIPVAAEELPRSGAEASTLVLVGLLVAGLGVSAVVYGRRRERNRTQA